MIANADTTVDFSHKFCDPGLMAVGDVLMIDVRSPQQVLQIGAAFVD